MNYNNLIAVLILAATAALGLIPILYPSLPRGPLLGLLIGALALAVLAAVMPLLVHRVRRTRGLPPEQTPADLRFMMMLIVILCPLAFLAVWMFPVFGSLIIMVVPIAYMIRGQQPSNRPDRDV